MIPRKRIPRRGMQFYSKSHDKWGTIIKVRGPFREVYDIDLQPESGPIFYIGISQMGFNEAFARGIVLVKTRKSVKRTRSVDSRSGITLREIEES